MPAMNPRLLLLEDDPVSAAFVRQALAVLPAEVEHAGTLAAARRRGGPGPARWGLGAPMPAGPGGGRLGGLGQGGLGGP
ncbi:MAG: hypothetical protein K0M70_14750, partial [Arenimonas sp.]|nr:hypothetical protein [Arenimonas sp.]